MPNWCSNSVTYFGEESAKKKLVNIINSMIAKEDETKQGQTWGLIDPKDSYLFDIYLDEANDFFLFETKWVPETHIINTILFECGLDYRHEFWEPIEETYGVIACKDGKVKKYNIEQKDRAMIISIDDYFLFEGVEYEVEEEIFDIILERKEKENERH